ncbi:MAG: hypothetical protein COS40_08540 [Deltaproteobacteria bacterium CG03_land_8_20_14_0_80_45_14]|nr:MAG: hypothetical protein COS40_08540 [Deltaproteobacteria bacterium CG03_land_8_20_14_0_80_45_14]
MGVRPEAKRRVIERGRLKHEEKFEYKYIIEIDETGQKRKYAFRPGECVELDPENDNPIDIIDFVSPKFMKDWPEAFREPWPEHEVFSEQSLFQRIINKILKRR